MNELGCKTGLSSLALGLVLTGCGVQARQPDVPAEPVGAYRISLPQEWAAVSCDAGANQVPAEEQALAATPWDDAAIERVRRRLGYTLREDQARK